MTKAQLIAENRALKNALRIVCTEPLSEESFLIRMTQKHIVRIEKMLWTGDINKSNNKFGGVING